MADDDVHRIKVQAKTVEELRISRRLKFGLRVQAGRPARSQEG